VKDWLKTEIARAARRSPPVICSLVLVFWGSQTMAQNIVTKPLQSGAPTHIELSPQLATTLLFPSPISGTFGVGLVGSGQNQQGVVQLEHPDGSALLVLRALSETAHITMTVLLEGSLYVFDLEAGSQPDVAVTLVKSDGIAPRAVEVTPQEIAAQRPKYDPELLVGFLRRARDAALLKPLYPELYQGYEVRQGNYTSDSGAVKTTVTRVHRFSKEDAIVLEGTVQNETTRPLRFDGRATTVQVANEVHPAKLTDCLQPIPAGATVPIDVVIQGDVDGGRANLSVENEFRIMLPGDAGVWAFKNGAPGGHFTVPKPVRTPAIPLTQTGPPQKEVQQ
jgi:hypothetical protein